MNLDELDQMPVPEATRSMRKRQAIMEAATQLFLASGYQGTSMDQVAARAAVSKQTVYKNFADKDQLFAAIAMGVATSVDGLLPTITAAFENPKDLRAELRSFARRYAIAVMQPEVLRLRRLIIAEAHRFPELAHRYYQRAPERVMKALASSFAQLADSGLLKIDQPLVAAHHFAYLVLAIPLDHALFHPTQQLPSSSQLQKHADNGVAVFWSAYGTT
jgi:TetR/AcrR family transcriptional repressor of mexJK operon